MKLSIKDIAFAVGGELKGKGFHVLLNKISTDTRTLKKGSLFIALRGENFDGHHYLNEALKKGTACLMVEEKCFQEYFEANPGEINVPVIKVKCTQKALGDLASFWRKQFSIPVWAITGSNGKTTTRAMAGTLLSHFYRVHQTRGNFNNLIGLPLTVLELARHHEVMILEMGMNQLGEIARLTEIAQPTLAMITNVGPVHLEFLKNIENVAKAKGELFHGLDAQAKVVVNQDDPFCSQLAEEAKIPHNFRISYGWRKEADIMVEKIRPLSEVSGKKIPGTWVRIRDRRSSSKDCLEISLPLPGEHNVYNLVAAVTGALVLGMAPSKICQAANEIQPVGSRSKIVQLPKNRFVLDDCYNANPISMRAALNLLESLSDGNPIVAVLGDMLELGQESDQAHYELGKIAANKNLKSLFAVGAFASMIAKGAEEAGMDQKHIHLIHDGINGKPPDDLIRSLVDRLKSVFSPSHGLLIKGSRGIALERVLEFIKEDPDFL